MTEDNIVNVLTSIDESVKKLAEIVGRLELAEERRLERDKHQQEFNSDVKKFMSDYVEKDKPVISKARDWHKIRTGVLVSIASVVILGILSFFFTFK